MKCSTAFRAADGECAGLKLRPGRMPLIVVLDQRSFGVPCALQDGVGVEGAGVIFEALHRAGRAMIRG